MTGGAQARLRPSLIPLFLRDIKEEKRNEGKKEEHVKNVKGKPKTFVSLCTSLANLYLRNQQMKINF